MALKVLLFFAMVSVAFAAMDLHLFSLEVSAQNSARCLDGSPSGYFYKPSPSGSKNWVIFMMGGGACFDEKSCSKRTHSILGSSSYWPKTYDAHDGPLDESASVNPDFFDWNHAFLPYCNGDVWSGARSAPNEWGLWFSGHHNFMTTISELQNTTSLGDKSERFQVLFTGDSAGGVGTFLHANTLADLLPYATVKAAPQAGFFFPNVAPYAVWQADPAANISYTYFKELHELWGSWFDPYCEKATTVPVEWCGDMSHIYDFIRVPLYIAENQYDTNQIYTQLKCPKEDTASTVAYFSYYGKRMRGSMEKVLKSTTNGLYFPSCGSHDETITFDPSTSPPVNGVSFRDSLSDWFFGRNKLPHQLWDGCSDPQGLPCNPTDLPTCGHRPGAGYDRSSRNHLES